MQYSVGCGFLSTLTGGVTILDYVLCVLCLAFVMYVECSECVYVYAAVVLSPRQISPEGD